MSNLKTNKVRVGGIDYEIEDTKAREILKILTGDTEESIEGKINLVKEELLDKIGNTSATNQIIDITDRLENGFLSIFYDELEEGVIYYASGNIHDFGYSRLDSDNIILKHVISTWGDIDVSIYIKRMMDNCLELDCFNSTKGYIKYGIVKLGMAGETVSITNVGTLSTEGSINFDFIDFISSESSDNIVEDVADNLAADALRKSAQILTNEEKQQVRINLGIDEVINEAITNVLNTEV